MRSHLHFGGKQTRRYHAEPEASSREKVEVVGCLEAISLLEGILLSLGCGMTLCWLNVVLICLCLDVGG
jgi:hypothetical protein